MSHVDDYAPRPRRDNRPAPPYPYPSDGMNAHDDYGSDVRGGRPHRADENNIPPAPPIGEGLKPAMRREGSRTRLAPDTRPQFPDEASNAPDLERKNRPRDRQFRDRRDGYESEEGEAHKKNMAPPRRHPEDDRPRGQDPRSRRPHDQDPPYPAPDYGRRRGGYDDEEPPRSSRKKRDTYYDDDPRPPRRRGDRPQPDIEYGSDPIPARRGSERRPARRRDSYSDEEEDYRPRRRRSAEDSRHAPRRGDELDYNSDGRKARRDDPYDDRDRDRRRRDTRSRRRYDDEDYDDYDRGGRDKDRRRGNKPNKPVMVGKYDVGPWIEKGQKHYATLAPIVTPLVINMARKYMSGQGGSGGSGRR